MTYLPIQSANLAMNYIFYDDDDDNNIKVVISNNKHNIIITRWCCYDDGVHIITVSSFERHFTLSVSISATISSCFTKSPTAV